MIRRIAGFVAAALVAGSLALASSAAPAGATPCVGSGRAHTDAPFGVLFNTTTNFSFNVDPAASACVGGGVSVSGSVSGNCIRSQGSGNSGTVQFQTVGAILVATGAVTGVAVILPDVTAGSECVTGTAQDFVLIGAAL